MGPQTTKYDFYKRGLQTFQDVKEYLQTWLEAPEVENAETFEFEGMTYTLQWGFTRACFSHSIYVNHATRTYIFVLADNCMPECPAPVLQGEFSDFERVVEEIAGYFTRVWKLEAAQD